MTVRISRKTLAVVGVLAAVFAASAAFAAIPDGGGVIHGCYDKASGAVRVTDTQTNVPKTCTTKEQALNWNQQGPQGVPGPKGEKGDPGTGDGYIAKAPDVGVGNSSTSVASLYVPAGSYILSAKLQVAAFAEGHTLNCSFGAGVDVDHASATTGAAFAAEAMSLTTAHTFATGGYVTLYCTSPSLVVAQRVVVTAVKVGELHFS